MNIVNSFALRNSRAATGSLIHSDIHLGLHVYTKLHATQEETKETSADLDQAQTMSIQYKLRYSGQDTVWTENYAARLHKSQQIRVEYHLGSNQAIELECTTADGKTSRCHFDMHSVLEGTMNDRKPVRAKETTGD